MGQTFCDSVLRGAEMKKSAKTALGELVFSSEIIAIDGASLAEEHTE